MRSRVVVLLSMFTLLVPGVSRAQDVSSPWMLMSDGVLFATVNDQGMAGQADVSATIRAGRGAAAR